MWTFSGLNKLRENAQGFREALENQDAIILQSQDNLDAFLENAETPEEIKELQAAKQTYTLLSNISLEIAELRKLNILTAPSKSIELHLGNLLDKINLALAHNLGQSGISALATKQYRAYFEMFSKLDPSIFDKLKSLTKLSKNTITLIDKLKEAVVQFPKKIKELDEQKQAYIASMSAPISEIPPVSIDSDDEIDESHISYFEPMSPSSIPNETSRFTIAVPILENPEDTPLQSELFELNEKLEQKIAELQLAQETVLMLKSDKEASKLENQTLDEQYEKLLAKKKELMIGYHQNTELLQVKQQFVELDFFTKLLTNPDYTPEQVLDIIQTSEHFKGFSENFQNAINDQKDTWNPFALFSPAEYITEYLNDEKTRLEQKNDTLFQQKNKELQERVKPIDTAIISLSDTQNRNNKQIKQLQDQLVVTNHKTEQLKTEIQALDTKKAEIQAQLEKLAQLASQETPLRATLVEREKSIPFVVAIPFTSHALNKLYVEQKEIDVELDQVALAIKNLPEPPDMIKLKDQQTDLNRKRTKKNKEIAVATFEHFYLPDIQKALEPLMKKYGITTELKDLESVENAKTELTKKILRPQKYLLSILMQEYERITEGSVKSIFLNAIDGNKKADQLLALINDIKLEKNIETIFERIEKIRDHKRNSSYSKSPKSEETLPTTATLRNKLINVQSDYEKELSIIKSTEDQLRNFRQGKIIQEKIGERYELTDSEISAQAIQQYLHLHKPANASQIKQQLDCVQLINVEFSAENSTAYLCDLAKDDKDLMYDIKEFISNFYNEQLKKFQPNDEPDRDADWDIKSRVIPEISALLDKIRPHITSISDETARIKQQELCAKVLAYTNQLADTNIFFEHLNPDEMSQKTKEIETQLAHYLTLIDNLKIPRAIRADMRVLHAKASNSIQEMQDAWKDENPASKGLDVTERESIPERLTRAGH